MLVRRRVLPAVLAMAALGCGVAAGVRETAARADVAPLGGPQATTPVLSARRVPTVLAAPIARRRLRADLATWSAGVGGSSCATVVTPDGDTALDLRGDLPVVPASTLKLLTATAALDVLGPDHRFRTTVVGPPPTGGIVAGDLALVGGGDPLLASPDYVARYERQPQVHTDLDRLAAALVDAGVRRVEGSVVGDESRYDTERAVAGWPARYLDQKQIGPLSALSVNDGFAQYPTVGTWRELVPAFDPAADAAAVLTRLLEGRGVDVVGDPRSGRALDGAPELAAVESEPLTEVVRELLQESDNNTAELLVKELGQRAGTPTTAGGVAQVVAALEANGFDLAGVTLEDGSGLSPDDHVTCRLLLAVLSDPETGPILAERLSVAGETGTLAKAFVGTSLEGHLHAKTGSLNAVAALTGRVVDDDGSISFAYVVNDPDGRVDEPAVVASQAALGQILLSWPQVPSLEALRPLPLASP
ncbi:MAG TPA: D-alanyl-D-alanine carboxypeptidase/D-alanyl-D-alanine-endopeptidase [Acidimicrobiales bacterium]|nr:D-alanyl-D-alanine carboxypeptidase/D-alanyl-D-alanine-endopeptidase [Acidimicrobiales bacterium]